MEPIFHVTSPAEWAAALAIGEYRQSTRGQTLAEVGFIHCSYAGQVERIADLIYAGETTLMLLVIDPALAASPIRPEAFEPGGELFPHIYGALPVSAVVEAVELHANAAGRFRLPGQ